MIDIHSHILYGMDDGAKSLDVSVAMMAAAAFAGTTDIVATSHASPEHKFQPALITERLGELRRAGPQTIQIHHGCDFHLTFDNVADALENPTKFTINSKRYLLVELSDLVIFQSTEPDFRRLQDAGMLLVITHPERNPLLRQRLETMKRWVTMGCYVQATGQSLFGRFGSKAKLFADTLLREDLVHFIASDGHDVKHRPPTMDEAFRYVSKHYGEQRALTLVSTNPLAALNGEEIPIVINPEPMPSRKWYLPWR